jgi:hypothetical protein
MTNPVEDPFEENLVTSWTVEGLVKEARKKFGEEAAQWASEAVPTGEWWVLERGSPQKGPRPDWSFYTHSPP